MPLKVIKKDGQAENFDRNKVKYGLLKSGATPEQAEKIALQVEAWAQKMAVNGSVKTADIRPKVLEFLRMVNQEAASSFEAYKKPV